MEVDEPVDVVDEALITSTYTATVTSDWDGMPWATQSLIAAYCSWQGGYVESQCTDIWSGDPRCKCGNGRSAKVIYVGTLGDASTPGNMVAQQTSSEVNALEISKALGWNMDDWGFTSANNRILNQGGVPYGIGSVRLARKTGRRWTVTTRIVRCANKPPGQC